MMPVISSVSQSIQGQAMPAESDRRLALMQLSDSFFPSGSFTLSHGLESLQQSGQVRSPAQVEEFLHLLLTYKVGTSDLVALTHAYRASKAPDFEAIRETDSRLFVQTLVEETRTAQQKSGRALLMVAGSTWEVSLLDTLMTEVSTYRLNGLHPVVFGVVGQIAGLSESDTQLAFAHNLATGLAGAAIRLGLVGHMQAQKILWAIAPTITAIAQQASSLSLDDMSSWTPSIDIALMQHKQRDRRLFTT